MEQAKKELIKRGYKITNETVRALTFEAGDKEVVLFPYSGWWFTGRDGGLGLNKLLKHLENEKTISHI